MVPFRSMIRLRTAPLIISLVALLVVAATRYSVIASALTPSSTGYPPQVFWIDDVACFQTDRGFIPGTLERGVFVSMAKQEREARALLSLSSREDARGLTHLRQTYKTLKQRRALYENICSAGPAGGGNLASLAKMAITSSAFKNNGVIPDRHSCWVDGAKAPGKGLSPALQWTNLPPKVNRLALLVHDKNSNKVHWFMVIEKTSSWFRKGVPEGIVPQIRKDTSQAVNDYGVRGYSGPCPPEGKQHRYTFELIALSAGTKGTVFGKDAAAIKKQLKRNTIAIVAFTGVFAGKGASSSPSPTPTPTYLSNGVQVAVGSAHACVLLTTGGVKCWGSNYLGAVGDGHLGAFRTTPVSVVGLSSGVTQIQTGDIHSCALMSSGAVKCWGYNGFGALGDGSTTQAPTPVNVIGLSHPAIHIAASHAYHTCAVLSTGGLKCWGWNDGGQLGDGTSKTNRWTPVDVVGLSAGVRQVTTGESHTCALLTSGGVKCWGYNVVGSLGDGTKLSKKIPVDVVGLTSGVTQIVSGERSVCALLDYGGVKCWGGVGGSLVPVDVPSLTSGVTQIGVGSGHFCAILNTGGVQCWGANNFGQIGDGTIGTDRPTPVNVTGLNSGVSQIAVGPVNSYAVLASGRVKCWGFNRGGLGDGTSVDQPTPVDLSSGS